MTRAIALARSHAAIDYGGLTRKEVAARVGTSHQAVEQAERRGVRWLWRYGLTREHEAHCSCSHCNRRRSVAAARSSGGRR